MRIFTISFCVMLSLFCAKNNLLSAQTKAYFVKFKDKVGTPFSVDKPEMFLSSRSIQRRNKQGITIKEDDLPVNPSYISQIEATSGVKVRYQSRWLNSILIFCTEAQHKSILNLPFVDSGKMLNEANFGGGKKDIEEKNSLKEINNYDLFHKAQAIPHALVFKKPQQTEENYGSSITQISMMGVDEMHKDGFHGEGMFVAVMDGGFPGVKTLSAFKDLDIAYTYNFVAADANVYTSANHGTRVLSAIAAYKPGSIVSPAYKARFALFLTEESPSESPVEEAYWLFAAEKADSLGVDVINTSLGYYDFDKASYNYTQSQLDGKTALITIASEKAFQRGMFLVTSAGNEGSKAWTKITFPADAPNTLVVGSVDGGQNYSSFSSIGPTADGRIKPDVVAMGSSTVLWTTTDAIETASGTSFASPLVCGLVTGFWQANPSLSAAEVLTLMRRSGSRVNSPNEQYGYGVPNYVRAQALKNVTGINSELLKGIRLMANPITDGQFHLLTPADFVGKNLKYQITTTLGQVVASGEVAISDIETSFSVQNVSKGLLFLKISIAEQEKVFRAVLE